MGVALGVLIATFFRPSCMAYGTGIFICGIVCSLLRVNSAYRFAAITLSIVLLIAHQRPPWIVASHRFVEVSLGIAMALLAATVWRVPGTKAGVRVVLGAFVYPTCKVWGQPPPAVRRSAAPLLS
ncbi:MAG: hypothetical protein DMG72_20065 [Acidobacteria bacterium]|nr:MAG: hypothetical protein DMG72_20065 [Acidobacteriota bacterium]